jgi:hypothetical protein
MSGLKNHDSHILMHQLLIALRGSNLPSNMVRTLVEMSTFFRGICSITLTLEDLNQLEGDIYITLCKMEHVFSPNFLVYVVMHLVREYQLGGPVLYRWMYSREVKFDVNI